MFLHFGNSSRWPRRQNHFFALWWNATLPNYKSEIITPRGWSKPIVQNPRKIAMKRKIPSKSVAAKKGKRISKEMSIVNDEMGNYWQTALVGVIVYGLLSFLFFFLLFREPKCEIDDGERIWQCTWRTMESIGKALTVVRWEIFRVFCQTHERFRKRRYGESEATSRYIHSN